MQIPIAARDAIPATLKEQTAAGQDPAVFQHMLDAAAAARTAEARGEGGPQPSAPSANTSATVYAIAERAAHLIQAA
jgi:hypothetical protein